MHLGWNPVEVAKYIFGHKQYIERHNESYHTEKNVYNNENT
jgi:hypothetical protein